MARAPPRSFPYQAFKASDGWLMIAAGNDNLFRKLCGALGLAELSARPELATNEARVRNRVPLIERIGAAAATFTVEALAKVLDDAGVPNSPLLTVD